MNRRVDCFVHILLKYEVDMFFNRQTKDNIIMWKYNRKEAKEKERHHLGINISNADFEVTIQTNVYMHIH